MGIIAWIVLGLIAGWLASVVMKSNHGVIGDMVLGIIGALVGGFLFNIFGQAGVTGFNLYSLIVAFVGAALIIWIARVTVYR